MTSATGTTTNLPLKPGTWALDQAHVRAGFAIGHLGVSKVRGHFAGVEAELVVGVTAAESSVTATLDMGSLDTGDRTRDEHVLGPDFLDAATRPRLAFGSTAISGADQRWQLAGDLTIADVTRPITLDVELGGVAEFVDGTRHAGFAARGELRRKDFGIDFGPADELLGEVVELELDLEFLEPA